MVAAVIIAADKLIDLPPGTSSASLCWQSSSQSIPHLCMPMEQRERPVLTALGNCSKQLIVFAPICPDVEPRHQDEDLTLLLEGSIQAARRGQSEPALKIST